MCDYIKKNIAKYYNLLENDIINKYRKKFFINRISGFGDILMLTLICKELKKINPNCYITVRTNQTVVLQNNKDIDELIFAEKIAEPIVKDLNDTFDIIYNFNYCVESYLVTRNGKLSENDYVNKSRIDLLFNWCNLETPKNIKLIYNPFEEEYTLGKEFWKQLSGDKKIMIFLWSTSLARDYSIYRYFELFNLLIKDNYSIILCGHLDKSKQKKYTLLEEFLTKNKLPILNLINNTKFKDLVSIMLQADIILSPDSGGLYLANAINKPSIGLFGCINPNLRINYFDNCNYIWKRPECLCNDRYPLRERICPSLEIENNKIKKIYDMYCMNLIDPKEIKETIDMLFYPINDILTFLKDFYKINYIIDIDKNDYTFPKEKKIFYGKIPYLFEQSNINPLSDKNSICQESNLIGFNKFINFLHSKNIKIIKFYKLVSKFYYIIITE